MPSLVEIKGDYYLQFYEGNKSPIQEKVALGTKRKQVVRKLQRRYEDAYALGEYDPWSGKKLDKPDRHLDMAEFRKWKKKANRLESEPDGSTERQKAIAT